MIRPAIVLVDVQNDFVTGPLMVKRATDIIAPLQRLVAAARKNNVPIVYSVDTHYPQDVEVTKKWGRHAIKGTKRAEVIEDLEPDKNKDYVAEKRTYSALYETGLEPLLKSMYKGDGAKNLLLGGLHTHLCVRHTDCRCFLPRIPNHYSQGWSGGIHFGRAGAGTQIS